MAKRRASTGDEVSLFPFLSILACLIGALVMLIVVLVVAQMGKAEGRTMEEIQRAQDYLDIKKEIQERQKVDDLVKDKLKELEQLQKDLEETQARYAKLRKLLDSSKDVQEQNKEISQQLQKELDDVLLEIDGLKKAQKETKQEIAALMAELEKRKVPKDKKPPPVMVQPSGSGMPESTKVYFVEALGGQLKVLDAWGEEYRFAAKDEVVVADHKFNWMLEELKKDPNSLLLFLVRDDGYSAFAKGAGWAQGSYGIRVGKLPIPGRGELQLSMFDKYRGKLPEPPPPPEIGPDGNPIPPPGGTPPPGGAPPPGQTPPPGGAPPK
ncbi:MAG: hypothetical protein KDK99_16355 [Verrucomicrobiales bacterium]|nr:hypothetical protein [Verrucomicrobiales bacterium]